MGNVLMDSNTQKRKRREKRLWTGITKKAPVSNLACVWTARACEILTNPVAGGVVSRNTGEVKVKKRPTAKRAGGTLSTLAPGGRRHSSSTRIAVKALELHVALVAGKTRRSYMRIRTERHMKGPGYKREILGTRACMAAEMATFEEEPTVSQSPTALFNSQGMDITPGKDRGVCKIVKRHGTEGERPMIGDKAYVHYTGKLLNGKKFDSSYDRKEPFVFNVGKGQVIRAWDIGVCSMQKGEVCLLLCKPDYAYGSAGSPPKIPPNSTLLFEVELLSFRGEELTEDGGILRRIKVKGEGYNNPNEGATVHVHLEGRCGDRLFESRDVTFIVGESEDMGIPLGVDRAMEKMQKGECCLLYLKPKYGYGREGKTEYGIEPNTELVYEVTLKDFEKAKEFWEMDLNEKLEKASLVKQKGTQFFKAGRYYHAVIQYQRIVSWLEMECGAGKEQHQAIQAQLLVAHLNLALCYLRLREYSQTVENCNKVIELDCMNEKALYRRGEARLLRNEFTLALVDFRQVLQVNPSNRAARCQIVICQRKIREHHEHDKKIYANMFQRFAEHDAKAGRLKRKREESEVVDQNNKAVKKPRRSQDSP